MNNCIIHDINTKGDFFMKSLRMFITVVFMLLVSSNAFGIGVLLSDDEVKEHIEEMKSLDMSERLEWLAESDRMYMACGGVDGYYCKALKYIGKQYADADIAILPSNGSEQVCNWVSQAYIHGGMSQLDVAKSYAEDGVDTLVEMFREYFWGLVPKESKIKKYSNLKKGSVWITGMNGSGTAYTWKLLKESNPKDKTLKSFGQVSEDASDGITTVKSGEAQIVFIPGAPSMGILRGEAKQQGMMFISWNTKLPGKVKRGRKGNEIEVYKKQSLKRDDYPSISDLFWSKSIDSWYVPAYVVVNEAFFDGHKTLKKSVKSSALTASGDIKTELGQKDE